MITVPQQKAIAKVTEAGKALAKLFEKDDSGKQLMIVWHSEAEQKKLAKDLQRSIIHLEEILKGKV